MNIIVNQPVRFQHGCLRKYIQCKVSILKAIYRKLPSHCGPPVPSTHKQLKPLLTTLQLPLFLHGVLLQGVTCKLERKKSHMFKRLRFWWSLRIYSSCKSIYIYIDCVIEKLLDHSILSCILCIQLSGFFCITFLANLEEQITHKRRLQCCFNFVFIFYLICILSRNSNMTSNYRQPV